MKHTMHLYLSDPKDYLEGDLDWAFTLRAERVKYREDEWFYCGTVDVNVTVPREALLTRTIDAIDQRIREEEQEFLAKKQLLEEERSKLLALPAPPEMNNGSSVESGGTG